MLGEHQEQLLKKQVQHLEQQLLKNEAENFDLKKQNFNLRTDLEHAIKLLHRQNAKPIH